MPAHTYLQSDDDWHEQHGYDDTTPEAPSEPAPPPPTNVWATLALQAGALRDIADGCKLLGVPAPPRLVTLLLREMTEALAGPDPLSADFDWGEVPGGARPEPRNPLAGPPAGTSGWVITEVRERTPGYLHTRSWYTDNALTADVCHAAGYEVRASADGT